MSILGMLKKTMKRGLNSVRRVGKASRSIARRGTNAVGLTRRRKGKRSTRRR
jgi:hypothetical protein